LTPGTDLTDAEYCMSFVVPSMCQLAPPSSPFLERTGLLCTSHAGSGLRQECATVASVRRHVRARRHAAARVAARITVAFPIARSHRHDFVALFREDDSTGPRSYALPKTGKRVRLVPLTPELAVIPREHPRAQLARQNEELSPAKRRGLERGIEAGWVLPSDKGAPTIRPSVRKPFQQVLEAIEEDGEHTLPHLTVDGLRRTLNNLLRQVTQGEVVRSVTGHVTERMTEHYGHVSRDEKSERDGEGHLLRSTCSRASAAGGGGTGGTPRLNAEGLFELCSKGLLLTACSAWSGTRDSNPRLRPWQGPVDDEDD
jgi:hypothetical protein